MDPAVAVKVENSWENALTICPSNAVSPASASPRPMSTTSSPTDTIPAATSATASPVMITASVPKIVKQEDRIAPNDASLCASGDQRRNKHKKHKHSKDKHKEKRHHKSSHKDKLMSDSGMLKQVKALQIGPVNSASPSAEEYSSISSSSHNDMGMSHLKSVSLISPVSEVTDPDIRSASPTRIRRPEPPVTFDPSKRRPYQCKFCNGKFLSPILWKQHVSKHTDVNGTGDDDDAAVIEDHTPQYECVICLRRFLFAKSRDDHCMIHHADVFIPPPPPDPVSFVNVYASVTTASSSSSSPSCSSRHRPDFVIKSSGKKKKKTAKRKNMLDENEGRKRKKMRSVYEESDSDQSWNSFAKEKDRSYKDHGYVKKKDLTPRRRHFTPSEVLAGIPVPNHMIKRAPEVNRDYTVTPEARRKCLSCSEWFDSSPEHDFHHPCYDYTEFRVMNGYKCFKCKDASIIYPDLKEVRIHALDHSQPKFRCNYCDTSKFMSYEIEHHVSHEHAHMLKADADDQSNHTTQVPVPGAVVKPELTDNSDPSHESAVDAPAAAATPTSA